MSNRGGGAKEEGGGLLTPCSAIGLVTLLLHVGMLLVQVWLGWRRREAVAEAVAPGPLEAPLEAGGEEHVMTSLYFAFFLNFRSF